MASSSSGLIAEISVGSASQPTRRRSGLHVRSPRLFLGWRSAPYDPRWDRIYGTVVTRRLACHGHPRQANWHRPRHAEQLAERLIGSIRRECLDHIIVLTRNIWRILKKYATLQTRENASVIEQGCACRSQVQRSGVINSRAILADFIVIRSDLDFFRYTTSSP